MLEATADAFTSTLPQPNFICSPAIFDLYLLVEGYVESTLAQNGFQMPFAIYGIDSYALSDQIAYRNQSPPVLVVSFEPSRHMPNKGTHHCFEGQSRLTILAIT